MILLLSWNSTDIGYVLRFFFCKYCWKIWNKVDSKHTYFTYRANTCLLSTNLAMVLKCKSVISKVGESPKFNFPVFSYKCSIGKKISIPFYMLKMKYIMFILRLCVRVMWLKVEFFNGRQTFLVAVIIAQRKHVLEKINILLYYYKALCYFQTIFERFFCRSTNAWSDIAT